MTTALTTQLIVSSNRLSEELPHKYKNFCKCLLSLLPEERIFTDKLRCLAPGTDASFTKWCQRLL